MPKSAKKKQATNKVSSKDKTMKENDIIDVILKDHEPLKDLIEVMKDNEHSFSERKKAFAKFAPLLTAHAKPEEQALYTFLKNNDALREEGFEGTVEHELAEQMVMEILETSDEDEAGAQIKVLAELVEHHLEEEEEDLFPELKKFTNAEDRAQLAEDYLNAKTEVEIVERPRRKTPPLAEKEQSL